MEVKITITKFRVKVKPNSDGVLETLETFKEGSHIEKVQVSNPGALSPSQWAIQRVAQKVTGMNASEERKAINNKEVATYINKWVITHVE